MGHVKTGRHRAAKAALGICATAIFLTTFVPAALAGGPFHTRKAALDIAGLNHACGAATDSKGDLYLSSAGTNEVKVYSPAHVLLTSIPDTHEPCGLAVTTTGNLFVSEKATGNVVRFKPNAYPFSGTPTYGSREVIDSSGNAKGIAVDPVDNRLYVAEDTKVAVYSSAGSFEANLGEGTLTEATGVAAYTYRTIESTATDRYLWVADANGVGADKLDLFGGPSLAGLKPRRELTGASTPDGSFGFGAAGAYLAADPGNAGPITQRCAVTQRITVNATAGTFKLSPPTAESSPASITAGSKVVHARAKLGAFHVGDAISGQGIPAGTTIMAVDEEAHTLELSAAATLTGNDVALTATRATAAIPYNATAEVVEDALEALVGAGHVSVTGGPGDSSGASPYFVAFRGDFAGVNVPTPWVDGSGLSGTAAASVLEQACTSGHLLLYDALHHALDEFDASGEYLDQVKNGGFSDAGPTAAVVDRSGGANDGTIYVTAGSGADAAALAFAPLPAPKRATLGKPISKEQLLVVTAATDSNGYVYMLTGTRIRIFQPNGTQILNSEGNPLLEDQHKPKMIASVVDSEGRVYVIDENKKGFAGEYEATYYTPSSYPPTSTTTYSRHEPALAKGENFPFTSKEPEFLRAIAVNPGPGPGKDHVFIATRNTIHEYDSAANHSTLLNSNFANAEVLLKVGSLESLAVDGRTGNVYVSSSGFPMFQVVNAAGTEVLARIDQSGGLAGPGIGGPKLAVDSSNGHVLEYDDVSTTAREYDASGAFLAEFGNFTEGLNKEFGVAFDNACTIHELTGKACEEFDPANGNFYVAADDTNPNHPPYDVTAFGPLDYGTAPATTEYKLKVKKEGAGSGTLTSSPAGISCGVVCEHEFEEGQEVTLMAKASPGSELLSWSGDCEAETVSPTEGTCEVKMSAEKEATAEFESNSSVKFPLEVILEGPATGEVSSSPAGIACPGTCSAEFGNGVEVTLTAKAGPASKLSSWGAGDCESETVSATEGTCTLKMSEAKEVKATFDPETPLLSVVKEGTGTGTVKSQGPGIDCGLTCAAELELNQAVTLKAKAAEGSEFKGWGAGDCESETVSTTEGTCTLTMSGPKQVTATFIALPRAKSKQPLIAYHEATLQGEVDPAGLVTKYHFEYLSEAEYEAAGESFAGAHETPVGELGAHNGFLAVQAPVAGLTEGTAYRFRLLAENAAGAAEDEGSFETFQRRAPESCPNAEYRFGLSANLPDCRAYELVTPANTNGLDPLSLDDGHSVGSNRSFSSWLTPQRGAAAGERLSYFTQGTLPGFEGNGNFDGYRAGRGAGDHPAAGWQSTIVSPDYVESAFKGTTPYGLAPDQLYSLWEVKPGSEPLPETLPHGIYLRTPAGFEALGRGSLGTDLEAKSQYLSAAGAHAIFSSTAHLEPPAPPAGNAALYDRAAGSTSAHVLTLPPQNAASEEEAAEFAAALRSKAQASYQGASEDGTKVVFKAGVGLYARLGDAKTERISPRTARVGETLSCAAGPLFDGTKELIDRHFQWLRNGAPIFGASGSDNGNIPEYATKAADESAALQCLTVATEANPRSVAVSAPVWISPLQSSQAPHPPAQITAPTPANPSAGTTETCNPGSWERANTLAYQWYRNGTAIAGATAQTYAVKAGDVPGTLQCIVTGKDAAATVARASGLTPTSPAPAEPAPVAGAQAAPKTTYAGISEDGRYVFYTLGGGESPARLFRFDTQSEEATEIAKAGIFALVSPDGSHAFFSSTEALSGGEENENHEHAEAGKHNLYAWDDTETRFVGRLSTGDFEQGAFAGINGMNLAAWTRAIGREEGSGRAYAPTRSTPGGGAFSFQSHARLTAYDNEGVGEIYRYDPSAEEGERLVCVSCDPSGAPPSADALLEDIRTTIGGVPIASATAIANLTDDGNEVFFQSFDRLLPEDANEAEDVYEWRAKGSEGPGGNVCTRPGGCLALISSGQGEVPSFLYAMSADGHDVFVHTKEKLVGMDDPGSYSIYDARVGGGIPEPSPPAPCQGDACQGTGTLPPSLPAPASTGGGEGGGEASLPPPSSCAKGKHRVKGRCVAAKHHKRHAKKHRGASSKRGGKR